MGALRVVILLVAAVAAIALALIVGKMVGHKPQVAVAPVAAAKPMAQVVVAHRDLRIGTRLAAGDLDWQPWPQDALNPSFITSGKTVIPNQPATASVVAAKAAQAAASAVAGDPMSALYGEVVREPILANEPVTNVKLVRSDQGGYLAVVLRPGMRAVAVPITVNTDAGGFILPGDRVDVIQGYSSNSGGQNTVISQTLLRNVRVLAIDQTSTPPKNGASTVGATATLEVAAADTEIIAKAKARGEMILALRSYADADGASGRDQSVSDSGVVHVFRNGQSTDVSVAP